MADYGLKVSKPGFDVNTCAKKDLIFNSENASLKLGTVLTLSVVSASDMSTNTTYGYINHNIGWKPAYLYYWTNSEESHNILHNGNQYQGSAAQNIFCYVDTTKFTCVIQRPYQTYDPTLGVITLPPITVNFRIIAFIDEI